jgi:heme exporter protein C
VTDRHLERILFSRSAALAVVGVVVLALLLIFVVAPTEATMGDVQRIVYLHVSVAWFGLAGYVAMGVCSGMHLGRRRLVWDDWAQAAGEVGWLCTTLTLVTGSVWAHEAWGVWWTWEPRLTSSLILWIIYAGIFLVRLSIDDPLRRARVGGCLALIGMVDVPLVIVATRWFRGVHPATPEMDPRMQLVLLGSVICFSALFSYLVVLRRCQLMRCKRTAELESAVWRASTTLYASPRH